ncbi:uncharacterized protein N0V89_001532 [Didymosphaeria variabile]|uniref:Uncharacterized protein n=1 Tax=Didymosphaeria variabile TaxID=1932322 RepID=A0A9W9CFZ9_9PLEO|nr:uncharacterized protein N0V89_001532 [Didymosphaeria variabile]KAJ4360963.1 hypothetical protein N0V89_001532 [Didymosphaeria variabile]
MFLDWFVSTSMEKPTDVSLAELRTAACDVSSVEKQSADSNATAPTTAEAEEMDMTSIDKDSTDNKATPLSDKAHIDSVALSPLAVQPSDHGAAPAAEETTKGDSATPSAVVVPDQASDWNSVIIDETYTETLSLDASLPDDDAAYSVNNEDAHEPGTVMPASAQTTPQPLNSAQAEQLEFNDEEVPLKEDADTFIITKQNYPSERNGTLKNEVAAAVCTPVATASKAGEAVKRKAEDILTPGTLKHVLDNMKATVTDGASAYVNGVTAGYDFPEIAGRVIEPIVNIADNIPSREETSKFVDAITDRLQEWFGKRKKRRSTEPDILDPDNMANMEDAHQVFAREMAAKARRFLVSYGICHQWQVMCDRNTIKWHYELQRALEAFYLEHKQYMRAEELMDAEPSWFADKQKGCFVLMLFAKWEVDDKADVGGRDGLLATDFALPEMFCKVSTADICPDPSSVAIEDIDNENGLEHEEDGVFWLKDDDHEYADEEEDAGEVWLDEGTDRETETSTPDDGREDGVIWLHDDADEESESTSAVAAM